MAKAKQVVKKAKVSTQVIRAGKYLKLVIEDGWEYVQRVNCSGVVIIVSNSISPTNCSYCLFVVKCLLGSLPLYILLR
jgi:hypothetical protein